MSTANTSRSNMRWIIITRFAPFINRQQHCAETQTEWLCERAEKPVAVTIESLDCWCLNNVDWRRSYCCELWCQRQIWSWHVSNGFSAIFGEPCALQGHFRWNGLWRHDSDACSQVDNQVRIVPPFHRYVVRHRHLFYSPSIHHRFHLPSTPFSIKNAIRATAETICNGCADACSIGACEIASSFNQVLSMLQLIAVFFFFHFSLCFVYFFSCIQFDVDAIQTRARELRHRIAGKLRRRISCCDRFQIKVSEKWNCAKCSSRNACECVWRATVHCSRFAPALLKCEMNAEKWRNKVKKNWNKLRSITSLFALFSLRRISHTQTNEFCQCLRHFVRYVSLDTQ